MALVVEDRVRETSTTAGTGTFTLAGAVTGYQSFAAIGNGNTTYYAIYLQGSNEWEVGIGTYTSSGTTLSRDTVLASSTGGAKIDFSAGVKDVFVTYPADRSVYYDSATNVTLNALTLSGGTANGVLYLNGSNAATSGSALTYSSNQLINTVATSGSFQLGFSVTNAVNADFNVRVANNLTDLQVSSATPLSFTLGASEQMRLTTTGLGIGTSSPAALLHLSSGAGTKAIWGTTRNFTVNRNFQLAVDEYAEGQFTITPSTTLGGTTFTTPVVAINATGNLGIGTNNPTYKLQVQDGYVGILRNNAYNSSAAIGIDLGSLNSGSVNNSATYAWGQEVVGDANGQSLTFKAYRRSDTTLERMRIDSSGNVGIGTSSPQGPLDVAASGATVNQFLTGGVGNNAVTGIFRIGSGAGRGASIQGFRGASSNIHSLEFYTYNSGDVFGMRLDQTGNLGIGTNNPGYKLEVNGGASDAMSLFNSTNSNGPHLRFAASSTVKAYIGGAPGFLGSGTADDLGLRAVGSILFATNGSAVDMTLDSSGNLGLGVTPSAWAGGFKVFAIGGNNVWSTNDSNTLYFTQNAYFDGAFKYQGSSLAATKHEMANGTFVWFTAPSGTAGNAISFTQAMTLDASGRLLVKATSNTGTNTKLAVGAGLTSGNAVAYISTENVDVDGVIISNWTGSATTNKVSLAFDSSGVGGFRIGMPGGVNAFQIYDAVAGAERARITSGGTFQTSLDASIYGVTVGRGGGAEVTNTAVGAGVLAANTSGAFNVAVGANAALNVTTVANMVAVGYGAIGTGIATGTYITAVGTSALLKLTSGSYNTGVGTLALSENLSGAQNTAVGVEALKANTTASNNTAVGYQAGYSNTTGTGNLFAGYQAGVNATTANYSVFLGRLSNGSGTATGQYSTGVGNATLFNLTSGGSNTAVGSGSLYNTTTGANNVAVGDSTLYSNTTASENTAVGHNAAYANTTGTGITAVGNRALVSNTTGSYNVAVGGSVSGVVASALQNNTTGVSNTAVGVGSLSSNTTASNNTAVGYQAGYTNTTGAQNTFIGRVAGYSLTTGTYNTFIGNEAGYFVTTGGKNTILGAYNGNQGSLDIRTASNYIVLSDGDGNPRGYHDATNWYFPSVDAQTTGNAANVNVGTNGVLRKSTSSLKYKRDVQDSPHGLAEVLRLRPVTYKSKSALDGDVVYGGLIAEEVDAAGLSEFVVYAPDGTPDALAYSNMVSLAFKAIQELKSEFDAYKAAHP